MISFSAVVGDELMRSYTVTYLDGTSETVTQCCGSVETRISRDGVKTESLHDEWGRRYATRTYHGGPDYIEIYDTLDAAGNVLKSERRSEGGTSVIELFKASYDTSGFLVYKTNALGGITYHERGLTTNDLWLEKATFLEGGGVEQAFHYPDGLVVEISGSAAHPRLYDYGCETNAFSGGLARYFVKETAVGTGGATDEWVKRYEDFLGRTDLVLYADGAYDRNFYNSAGRLARVEDPDGVRTGFEYNDLGEQTFTAVDLDPQPSDTGKELSVDRITKRERVYATKNFQSQNHTVRKTSTSVWKESTGEYLFALDEQSTDGKWSWRTVFNKRPSGATDTVVSWSRTDFSSGGVRETFNYNPAGDYTVSRFEYGRLVSVTQKDSGGNALMSVSYGYDGHGRQDRVIDSRNGTAVTTFNAADLPESMATPPSGTGLGPQVTWHYYDTLMRLSGVLNPDGTTVTNHYRASGELEKTAGARTYTVDYIYDPQGRVKTMTTWRNAQDSSVTTWNYDVYRGWLTSKVDAAEEDTIYSYTDAGRPYQRQWSRTAGGSRITATYGYTVAGELETVTYNDSATPGVTYAYDRRGRLTGAMRNGSTVTYSLDDMGHAWSETHSGGTLGGRTLYRGFDSHLRLASVSWKRQWGRI